MEASQRDAYASLHQRAGGFFAVALNKEPSEEDDEK